MTDTKLSFQSYFQTAAGDPIRMAADTYRQLAKTPGLVDLLGEGIGLIGTRIDWGRSGAFITRTVEFPTLIGSDHCLETPTISIDVPALFFWTRHAILYREDLPRPFQSNWRRLMVGAGTLRTS